MTSLYNAVASVLGDYTIILNGNDYAPLVTAIVTGLVLVITVANVFAFLRFLTK